MKKRGIFVSLIVTVAVLMFLSLNLACRKSPIEPTPVSKPPLPGHALLSIRVLDVVNMPINQVNIEIISNQHHQAKTDSSGTVNIQLPYGSYNVSVSSFGFNGSNQSIELNSPNQELTFNLQRRNAIRVVSIEPPCGTLNVPYDSLAVRVEVEFSVDRRHEYLVSVLTSLSNNGVSPIDDTNYATTFEVSNQFGQIGTIINKVGLYEHHRPIFRRTLYIINELFLTEDSRGNPGAKRVGMLTEPVADECLLGYQ